MITIELTETQVVWTIIFIIYLVSICLWWWYHHVAYSKGGVYERIQPDSSDVFLTFFPLLNTMLIIIACFVEWPKCKHNKGNKLIKFFRINK